MKRIYEIIWSDVSEKDLISIIEYIAQDSPSIAYDKFKDIKEKASCLYSFPDRGRMIHELQEQGITQYRELIVSPWRIIYRVSEKRVYVVSVLDSRQNVEDILLKRLIGSML
jgi:toxin ParE1/3/4